MAKKRFHYLIADRDSVSMGDDASSHVRKWKITGEETIADAVAILLANHLPCNPPNRTETWLLLCHNVELAIVQQNWDSPIFFVDADKKVREYFNDRGDMLMYSKCLWAAEREKFFREHGIKR